MITHALFKALLFICAGELIAIHAHGQDLRWLGNLVSQAPVASSCILVANSALCGIPFMAGFYSKDLIIEWFLHGGFNWLIICIAFIAIGFTSFYTVRFRLVILWGLRLHNPIHITLENNKTVLPILIMSLISVIGGARILWLLPDLNIPSLLPLSLKTLPLLTVTSGLALGWISSVVLSNKSRIMISLHLLNYASCIIWFLVPVSSQFQLRNPLLGGHLLLKSIDHGWLELIGGQGLNIYITKTGIKTIRKRSGSPTLLVLKSLMATSSLLLIWSFIC
jgi:NADH-ubiquinone oxidoreductase chain 5